MSYSYKWEVKDHRMYHVLRPFAGVVLNAVYDLSCDGRENVPKTGGFILACNHIDALDPVALSYYSGRTCYYMAKSEFFERRITGSFLSALNAFPVKRGRANSDALGFAEKILKNGDVLGIFPEGKRSKDGYPDVARTGVAHLAGSTGADVLPACLYRKPGGRRIRPSLTVRYGKLIPFNELGLTENRTPFEYHAAAELIMSKIVELWDEAASREG